MVFNSKILLFGEYTVLYDSDALLVPFPRFSGKLEFWNDSSTPNPFNQKWQKVHNEFVSYLKGLKTFSSEGISQLENDLQNGLYFNSNIPVGYGAGSSGAFVAAIYSKYFEAGVSYYSSESLLNIRTELAQLESFFHGSSSGLDPLVSLLNKAVVVCNNELVATEVDYSIFHPFLIDTGVDRLTGNLVSIFREKCKSESFMEMLHNQLIISNNECISSLLNANQSDFFPSLKNLSKLQFEHFSEMIPQEFVTVWNEGLKTGDYYLKLCGAGGGGFILGYAKGKSTIDQLIMSNHINVIGI